MSDIWTPSSALRKDLLFHPELSCRHENFRDLGNEDQEFLGRLERQSERWLHKRYFKENVEDRRIALLNGYHRSNRLLNCMMIKNGFTHNRYLKRCDLAWFCPFCAYLKGQDQLKKYGPAWDAHSWHWMVLSIRGGIEVADPDHDTLSEVWDAMKRCCERARLEKVFEGYQGHLAWEELAVYKFWPRLRWTPHLNILIQSSSEPDRKRFERVVEEEWYRQDPRGKGPRGKGPRGRGPRGRGPRGRGPRGRGPRGKDPDLDKLRCEPTVSLKQPKSEAHFYELLQYIKPIDLVTPYLSGFEKAKAAGQLETFHQEVRLFFEGYAVEASRHRSQKVPGKKGKQDRTVERTHYFSAGTCHGSCPNAVGITKEARSTPEHQSDIRRRIEDAWANEELQRAEDTEAN